MGWIGGMAQYVRFSTQIIFIEEGRDFNWKGTRAPDVAGRETQAYALEEPRRAQPKSRAARYAYLRDPRTLNDRSQRIRKIERNGRALSQEYPHVPVHRGIVPPLGNRVTLGQ